MNRGNFWRSMRRNAGNSKKNRLFAIVGTKICAKFSARPGSAGIESSLENQENQECQGAVHLAGAALTQNAANTWSKQSSSPTKPKNIVSKFGKKRDVSPKMQYIWPGAINVMTDNILAK